MPPPRHPSAARSISQQAFDEMVQENISDLGMDPTEALQDAIETLTLQGVDLSGIATSSFLNGEPDPVIKTVENLKNLMDHSSNDVGGSKIIEVVKRLKELCLSGNEDSVKVVTRNGGVEIVCEACSRLRNEVEGSAEVLETMALLIYDLQTSDTFFKNGGPKMLVSILNDNKENLITLRSGFSVVAAAAAGNEIVKEAFIELKIDELTVQILRRHGKGSIESLYDAIRVLLTPDDNRVVASQVYGYARRFAKVGIAEALVDSLKEGLTSPSLVSATIALRAVAVNDEICRSIADNGGVDAVLRCIDDSGEQGNKTVAKVCCTLLSKLAGSDSIKTAIVEKGGLDRLIKFSARFADDPSVLQEVMSIISVMCLRSPDKASRAIEAGAGDLAIQAMQRFPGATQMQRNACLMIRNLVARNPENRTLLLNNGIEKIIRKVKKNHESCKEAATDALRDLGLDNYNL